MSPDCPGWSGYPRHTGILRRSSWGRLDVPGLSGLVWVSLVYGDTQTQWLGKVGCSGIVRDGLGILGVRGYSDTVVGDSWMSRDCPGWSGYPWCTGILRHSGWGRLDVPGLSGMVWVSSVYGDTQTQWLGTVGYPGIVRDGLGILGVRGYSDTVVGKGWMSRDCPGWSGYPRCTGILRHSGWGRLDVPGLSGLVWVSSVYGDTQTQWLGTVGCPGIVRVGLGILKYRTLLVGSS